MTIFRTSLLSMGIVVAGLAMLGGNIASTPARAAIPRISLAEVQSAADPSVEEALQRYRAQQCRHWRACVIKH